MRDIKYISGVPLYFQLKQSLQERILEGEYKFDEKIPPEAELCREYEVSRITVRKAIDALVQENFLYTKQGVGTFVKYNKLVRELSRIYSFSEDMRNMGLEPSSRTISFRVESADLEVRGTLGLPMVDPQVHRIIRVRLANKVPILLEDTMIPHYLCPDLQNYDLEKDSLYRILCDEFGIIPNVADETYEAAIISSTEAELLKSESGRPVFRLCRTARLADGRMFELTNSVGLGSHMRFKLHLEKDEAAFSKDLALNIL